MLTIRFSQALVYAADAHKEQTRKGTSVPYVAHVLAVAALALENGASEDEAIAALLHDTVEDCGGESRLREVGERFGTSVAEIVLGCTDTMETPKPPWRARKEAWLHTLDGASPSVLLVAACDKLHNIRSLLVAVRNDGEAAWARFKGGKEGTLWYYRAALATLKRCGVSPRLAHEIEISLEELHRAVDSKVPLSDVHYPDA
jgi:(p)ppGpp synthase/HD superfamily hydrolase